MTGAEHQETHTRQQRRSRLLSSEPGISVQRNRDEMVLRLGLIFAAAGLLFIIAYLVLRFAVHVEGIGLGILPLVGVGSLAYGLLPVTALLSKRARAQKQLRALAARTGRQLAVPGAEELHPVTYSGPSPEAGGFALGAIGLSSEGMQLIGSEGVVLSAAPGEILGAVYLPARKMWQPRGMEIHLSQERVLEVRTFRQAVLGSALSQSGVKVLESGAGQTPRQD
ncbi:hypothetical protein [Streptomyces sp. NPDC053542]|uniref:hypothetical protein n=1 Tax=Streptomyces sp. NPDC053542 TaxID=3365710 RepID=UPI0037CF5252